ncbi:hypothetical protein [Streptomyces sp. NPDC014734]|uniref:hypothetical protein n=1 Tax=Streptomyces sp. NPDC014734 TaxID=3364886 RepID=UPI0036F84D67
MDVEIPSHLRDTASRIGAGVPYALKILAGRLADDPDMGRPSGLPGILTTTIDGDLIEDCPALAIGYIREPDRIQIRYVSPAFSTEHTEPAEPTVTGGHVGEVGEIEGVGSAQGQDPDQDRGRGLGGGRPAAAADRAVTVREVADAWRRITDWLRHNAPDSHAALRAGADPAGIAALEKGLGIRIPVELHVLWLLTGGDDGVNGRGCLPGGEALMPLDAVAAVHRLKTDSQTHEDTFNARRPEYDRITVWKATWVPVVALGPADNTSGLYLDTATGYLGRWSRYHDGPGGFSDEEPGEGPREELDTLVTYLEEAADMLEAPALATRDTPGLVGGALVWRSGVNPAREERWQPVTG